MLKNKPGPNSLLGLLTTADVFYMSHTSNVNAAISSKKPERLTSTGSGPLDLHSPGRH